MQKQHAFDELYSELIKAVEERRRLQLIGATPHELIDSRDHLHTIRAQLAEARQQIAANVRLSRRQATQGDETDLKEAA